MPKERPTPSVEFTPADRLCVWMTEGRRCTMMREGSLRIGDDAAGYCAWHMLTLASPRWANDYDEFERYCLLGRGKYCGQWTHYPPSVLWDCVRGLGTYLGRKPAWCGRIDCRHFDIRDTARWSREKPVSRSVPSRDSLVLAMDVAQSKALPAHPAKPVEQQKAELEGWVRKHEAKQDGEAPF